MSRQAIRVIITFIFLCVCVCACVRVRVRVCVHSLTHLTDSTHPLLFAFSLPLLSFASPLLLLPSSSSPPISLVPVYVCAYMDVCMYYAYKHSSLTPPISLVPVYVCM